MIIIITRLPSPSAVSGYRLCATDARGSHISSWWEPELGGLQQELYGVLDEQRAEELLATHARKRNWSDVRRFRELQDPSVSHDWLWALSLAHDSRRHGGCR